MNESCVNLKVGSQAGQEKIVFHRFWEMLFEKPAFRENNEFQERIVVATKL